MPGGEARGAAALPKATHTVPTPAHPSCPPHRSAKRHQPVLREIVLELLQHFVPVTLARANDGLLVLEARKLVRLFDSLQGPDPLSLAAMAHCLVDPGQAA